MRRLDEAVEVRADPDVAVRAGDVVDAVDVALDHLERLLERLRVLAAHTVVELVLGEDQPDHAVALRDLAHRRLVEEVDLAAEAVAGVRGDDGMVGRRRAGLAVEPVEQRERLLEAVGPHVRDVDQHALAVHRAHRRRAELGQPDPLVLREQRAVDDVGEEGEGGRVGGDATPEQVRERDVGDAALGQRRDVLVDLLRRRAEVEAALDAVHERDLLARPARRRGRWRGARPPRPGCPRPRPRPSRAARRAGRSSPARASRRTARRGPSRRTASRGPTAPPGRRPGRGSRASRAARRPSCGSSSAARGPTGPSPGACRPGPGALAP